MQLRRAPALVLALAMTALAAPTAVATPASEPVAPVTNGAVVLHGHGNGHGHGMSQYGARGAAIKGLSASSILGFYYPGTTIAQDTGAVKVLITADNDHRATVLPERGLKLVDLAAGKSYRLPTKGQKAWRLRVAGGKARVDFLKRGAWHPYRPGRHATLVGNGEFRSATGLLTLRTPKGDRRYRGYIRLVSGNVVNVLRLDAYVRGVVPSEMPALWQSAALQAQAIAARTYAAREIADNPHRSYSLCDTSHCQVYGGVAAEQPGSNAAVAATANQILTYQGLPAFAQFSASNGGYTVDGGEPYLTSKHDPYDATPSNPYTNWTTTLTASAIEAAYPGHGTLVSVQVGSTDAASKRVTQLVLKWSNLDTTMPTGEAFRSIFGLRSTYFSVAAS